MASKAEKNFKKSAAEMFISSAEQIPESKPQPATTEENDNYVTDIKVPAGYRLQREYKSERMQLLIRPTTKKMIKQQADARGISMNDLVNQILDEYAERMMN